jgi:hypothetical protein
LRILRLEGELPDVQTPMSMTGSTHHMRVGPDIR